MKLAILAVAPLAAFAQPAFDVASVKPVPPGGMTRKVATGSLSMQRVGLGYCIRWAYGVPAYQVEGPVWFDPPTGATFDIDAKAATPATEDELKLMLQRLLAERFKLVLHHERKELPVFGLVVAKGGSRLRRPATDGERNLKPLDGSLAFERYTMAELAYVLSGPPWSLARPVVDMTGLEGRYDFTLDKRLDEIRNGDSGEAILIGSLERQLGLTLERLKAPFDVLVIDHAEKSPTPN